MKVFILHFSAGLIIIFGSLWGGAWLTTILPRWTEFPLFMSILFGCMSGAILVYAAMDALAEMSDGDDGENKEGK